jgi:ubiquinone/menaquinone biosynthesis C-methylase UbiE
MNAEAQDSTQRSATWRRIWEIKYDGASGPVHKLDGFDLLTAEQWSALVSRFCDYMGSTKGMDILEVGCGAGAFLQHIPAPRSLAGLDYSQNAIDFISKNLAGQFFCSEAKNIPFPDTSFDIVFSFGVFFYFENLAYAEAVLGEMFRVARPGARIFILDVNDEEKIDTYHRVRGPEGTRAQVKKTDADTTHLFFRKDWFQAVGRASGAKVSIVDETELGIEFHSGCEYRFAVRFDVPG